METIEPTAKKLHPLVATAAVAVIVVSVLGAIVLITDQVAAHRGPESTVTASNDPATNATDATAPQANSAEPQANPVSPPQPAAHPAPTHKVTHPAKPAAAPAVADTAGIPPPPSGTPAVPPDVAMAAPPAPPPVCNDCGIVAAVRTVKVQGQGSGVGAVAGGAVGGLVGNQFGSGNGKTAMTILGVLGGAVGGHEAEKEIKASTHYEVDVRLDNGQLRTVRMPANPGPIVGTRVRIDASGQLIREAPPQS